MYRIFIVEDDEKISAILRNKLEQYGYEARSASQFRELMPELEAFGPHLVLLDINLPYFDGYYWCRQIRRSSSMPILFISARAGEMDQVMAIENGGDDYITKPIQLELMLAKVRGALRRSYGEYAPNPQQVSPSDSAGAENGPNGNGGLPSHATVIGSDNRHGYPGFAELEAEGLKLHLSRNELEWRGRKVELTKNEQQLAECLLKRAGHVVLRERLLEALWDDVQFVDDNTLTVNVTRLRKKLEELGLPKVIETFRGQGYKLSAAALREHGGSGL